ncbi:MAG: M23 family metallopeptidase [bacterium]|nr:M23 family metallopeptidase [bacterium]
MPKSKLVLILAGLLVVTGIILGIVYRPAEPANQSANQSDSGQTADDTKVSLLTIRADYAQHNAVYQFSAELPEGWVLKYVPASEAVAAFPPINDNSNLDQAQIFIRHFEANDFQTLSTVNILRRESTKVGTHQAVRYEIEKKAEAANFANQPIWRNQLHDLIDIRYAPSGRTSFFVIARNPAFEKAQFEAFIASLQFHNDRNSLRSPLDRARERVSKKTFGTKVSPTDSPVSPERFSGYHTGWDFEIFPDELTKEVVVTAFCGGQLAEKKTAEGYGGVVAGHCQLEGQDMTVVYGHLKLTSVTKQAGDYLAPGDRIGVLGADKSTETDGERKHLHFGLHKDAGINIRGYVSTEDQLTDWIDPKKYL